MSVVVVALPVVVAVLVIILVIMLIIVVIVLVLLLAGARLELPREGLGSLHQVAEGPALRALHNLLDVLFPMMRVGVGLCWRITESGVVRLRTIVRKVQMRVVLEVLVVLDT